MHTLQKQFASVFTAALAYCLLLPLIAITGCGKTSSNRGEVSGSVTVDGAPPATGAISFTPAGGLAPPVGAEIVNGSYSVEVPLGQSSVAIRVPKVVGEKRLYDTPDSPVVAVKHESLPKKFNDETELSVDVKPGLNQEDFKLTTQ